MGLRSCQAGRALHPALDEAVGAGCEIILSDDFRRSLTVAKHYVATGVPWMDEPTRVRCLLYDVSELYDANMFGHAIKLLPWEDRRAQVGRFRLLKDRCLCLGAGLLAAHALREAGASDLRLGYGAYGKPHLMRHSTIHFSLSHSGTMALCAVADQPVGADVEEHQTYDDAMIRICCTNDERTWICGQPDRDRAFTRIWVRKESYLKLVGTGITDDVRACDVTPHSAEGRHLWFWEHEASGYAIGICVRKKARVAIEFAAPRFWMRVQA